MKDCSRKEQRRYKQSCSVIDNAFKIDSRLAMIRVDLSYEDGKSSLERIDNDLKKLRSNSRSKPSIFKNQIGYVIKLEKGKNENYHAHALFIFKGHEVKNHKFKAEQIGKYWKDTITKGDGIYHNSNIKAEKHSNYNLGVLERKDEDAINALKKNVVGYLCKDEQSIKSADGSDKKIKELRCSVRKK